MDVTIKIAMTHGSCPTAVRKLVFNATTIALCSFTVLGLWGAINSLEAGGAQKPYLVNTGNSLVFCLMIVLCWFTSSIVEHIGIKGALVTQA